MARKDSDNQVSQRVGDQPNLGARSDEFDAAVTTEITAVVNRAFADAETAEPDDVTVTDTYLTTHVEPSDDVALAPGFLLNDRFEIVELVHSGGMAHVYKAIDRRRHSNGSGGVHVGIKMMRPSIASKEQAHLALEREAAKAQTLSHPNIINIFDFDEHDGQFFLVMEWLEGESVNSLLRRTSGKGMPASVAWSIIEGAAAGVQHAHKNNVVHADINPSNIFITQTQDIKLLDFGVARYTGDPADSSDDRFAWVTQTYASPEVSSGLVPTFEDDIFSLGCVAYRLLSGNHPFGGSPPHVAKHLGFEVEPLHDIPEEEWQALSQALAYDRSDRPSSVSIFLDRGAHAPVAGISTARDEGRIRTMLTLGLAASVALVVFAGSWWLFATDTAGEAPPIVETSDSTLPGTGTSVGSAAPSAADAIVSLARQALSEGKLVEPVGEDARTLFAAALAIEPGNPAALRGMRAISDEFVHQASEALNAGDAAAAYDALATAAAIDADNPAIQFANQLLTARGESELAEARIAVAVGDLELATERLARADLFRDVDRVAIQSVRQQIAQRAREVPFLASLATAKQHSDAGRLSTPPGENAHELLIELKQTNSTDPRLVASMEQLGERLLTRAVIATEAGEIDEASELIDAVDALGVLSAEAELARVSLQTAIDTPIKEDTPQTVSMDQSGADVLTPEIDDMPAIIAASEATPDNELTRETLTTNAALPDVATNAEGNTIVGAAAEPVNASGEPQPFSVENFGIEKYVAPRYPRRALARGIEGSVEVSFNINADGTTGSINVLNSEPGRVFAASAVSAVSKWRFVPQEYVVRAQITLRFDLAD